MDLTECQCEAPGWCSTLYRPGVDPEDKQARMMIDVRHKECKTNPSCEETKCWFKMLYGERLKAERGELEYGPVEFIEPKQMGEGAGTELLKLLNHPVWKFLRIQVTKTCKCNARAMEMNEWGTGRCRENVDTILNWLEEEHRNQEIKLPFIRTVAKKMVLMAIKKAEGKERIKVLG